MFNSITDFFRFQLTFLNYLLVDKQVPPHSVMVLSPYLAQCKKLKKAVANLAKKPPYKGRIDLASLHIGSVITSQGNINIVFEKCKKCSIPFLVNRTMYNAMFHI